MYDVIIVGGGPSGMSVALNVLRSSKKVLIIEKENFGGQIANSPRVENFPTIKSISGLELSNRLLEQIVELGVEFEMETVTSIKKEDKTFFVKTNYNTYEAKSVVIASGVEHKHLNIPGEDLKGVSYCAVCDGAFYKDKEVIVIGDANTALQYSLLLSDYVKKVKLCTLFNKFFADKILVDRALKKDNIVVYHNLDSLRFEGDDEVNKTVFVNTQTNEEFTLRCDGVFIAIGQIPSNEYLKNLVDLKDGYIVVNDKKQTKTVGLYAVGDCTYKAVRQLATAMGDAAVCSYHLINYLQTI